IDEKRGTARVVFTVNEGVKGAVRQVHFEGNQHFSEKVLRKQMKTRGKTLVYFLDKSGRLDEVQLQQDLDKIREWYQNHGYIDVHYKIEEGDRSFVNRINIAGNTRTKDKVIRREVLVAPGDVFNTVRVDTTKKRLENLGYFAKVETYPEDTEIPGRKDLTILV